MALRTFECVHCEQKFEVGDWGCKVNGRHEVKEQTYHVANSCADMDDRMKSNLYLVVLPERNFTDKLGNEQMEPAKTITFHKGLHTTTDPEVQFNLETRFKATLISPEAWEKMYIPSIERQKMQERQAENNKAVLAAESNALLEQIKNQKAELEALQKRAAK